MSKKWNVVSCKRKTKIVCELNVYHRKKYDLVVWPESLERTQFLWKFTARAFVRDREKQVIFPIIFMSTACVQTRAYCKENSHIFKGRTRTLFARYIISVKQTIELVKQSNNNNKQSRCSKGCTIQFKSHTYKSSCWLLWRACWI